MNDIARLKARVAELEAALRSIARNTCCDGCQEAALVAEAALLASAAAPQEPDALADIRDTHPEIARVVQEQAAELVTLRERLEPDAVAAAPRFGLLPCPFCGDTGLPWYSGDGRASRLGCKSCRAWGPRADNLADAGEKWNLRAAEQAAGRREDDER